MELNGDVINLTKQLVKAESDLEAANTAADTMKVYVSALIRENADLRQKIAKIRYIVGNEDD